MSRRAGPDPLDPATDRVAEALEDLPAARSIVASADAYFDECAATESFEGGIPDGFGEALERISEAESLLRAQPQQRRQAPSSTLGRSAPLILLRVARRARSSCGGRRRPGARRIVSRSAGGGSSGDDGPGEPPGEHAGRAADDDVDLAPAGVVA
jgi:hypothetical protein